MDPLNVLTGDYTLKSKKPCNLSSCTKEEILDYFENSYSLNESLFTSLAAKEAFYMCPDRLRLPLIFYYAHTAVVYWNKMLLAGLVDRRLNIEFETMFETGVDEQSWDDTENYRMGGAFKWPPLEEVVEYRRKVRNAIRKVIADTRLELPVTMDSPWWALFMGFEHERIHFTTSSVLIQQLPIYLLRKPKDWRPGPAYHGQGMGDNKMVTVPACEVTVGKPRDFPSYGWDNEYPECKKMVPAFEASQFLITNKEFLAFVESGCYKKKQYWTKEGWQWRNFRKVMHPIFWVCNKGCLSNCGAALAGYSHCQEWLNGEANGSSNNINSRNSSGGNGYIPASNGLQQINNNETNQYRLRTLCEEIPMPWDWPVAVNYHEAKAYCRWKGQEFRLMTEAEHCAIRDKEVRISNDTSADILYHSDLQERHNANLAYTTHTPVNLYPPTKRGFYDVFGNMWEWMEDHFNGLPGSLTHHLYDDFSTPTFDGRHNVILGGCNMSTGDESSCFARYAFRRHFYQHASFRLVRSLDTSATLPVALICRPSNITEGVCLPVGTKTNSPLPSTNIQLSHESDHHLRAQLLTEYGAVKGNLASQLAEVCRGALQARGPPCGTALDLICGCGKLSFELCRFMKEVLAVDYCKSFLMAAENIQEKGHYASLMPDGKTLDVHLPEGVNSSRVFFKQFTWIPNEILNFDLVVFEGIDRVLNKKGVRQVISCHKTSLIPASLNLSYLN
ncbi:ergothioneine biosynthesis protein 1-like isoform X2 [Acanthaster planci]|uniref:Ergothioneine biosynthesis protein 1-like isoform X2 n=1 Tax=Acanthaster planci TaxID=133434 RepID=A0A8B7ZIQ1_ACAPL|nr:ergothioneine biosynthesis protein 1-like isoform X2 [Acanthaster planci]